MKNLSSQEHIKLMEARFLVEQQYEWNKWTKEIPSLNFKKKWNVKIIPPCTGAIIRFRVTYKNRWVSVYLDCYDELGFFGEPYWEIYPYLPRETRGYVPNFIAANYIMNYYCQHGICPMQVLLPAATDTMIVSQDIHFQQIADLCQVSMEEIRALNPQYKKDIIPGASMECILRLPVDAVVSFIESGDSIYEHRADELFTKRKYVTAKDGKKRRVSVNGGTYHTIRRGETLSTIARKYGITVTTLRELNNLKGNNITAGKKLRVSD